MSSTPQRTAALGNYNFAHNPPTPQSQHNEDVSFGSSLPAMGSNGRAFQMLGPNGYSPSASSQRIAAMSDIHAVAPVMTNSNVVLPWESDSLSNRNAILHGSLHNSPTPHDLGGARPWNSSHPAVGGVYLPPHVFQTPGPIGHTSPISSQHSMTGSDAHSIVPMMANPNASLWAPDDLRTAISDVWSQCVPYLHDLGGTRSWAPSHPAIGRVYLSPHTFPTPEPIGHTSPVYSQCGMTTSDTFPVVPMMANPSAIAWTPDNLGTAVSHGPSQSAPYPHNLGGVSSGFQLPPAQSELPINQPSPLFCQWVHNNTPCGYEGTLEDLKQHWHDNHLPGCPGAMIQCQWERCSYHKRGNRSINVMYRSSVWRHISEVHLMHRRNN